MAPRPDGRRGHARRAVATASALAAGLVLLVASAQAAPPPNDAFAGAVALEGESGTVSGTTVEATKEPGEPPHAGNPGGRSVWYRWTAPFSGAVLFETCGSGFDTLLAVYTGTGPGALQGVAGSDDACDIHSRVAPRVVAGTTYWIAVDGYDGASGSFVLRWSPLPPPANDDFASAQPLAGATGTLRATNLGATLEPGEPGEGGGTASLWYTWTVPLTGGAFVDTCGSQFDTILAVYTGGELARLTLVRADDDSCELASRVSFRAQAGTTYRIQVDGLSGSRGDLVLNWNVSPPPRNDRFTRARTISGARGTIGGTTIGATKDAGEGRHAGAPGGASVWYRWRAPRAGTFSFDTCTGVKFDTVLAVYRRDARNRLVRVAADDDRCRDDVGSLVIVPAQTRETYFIAVDAWEGATGTFRLRWGRPPSWIPCIVPLVRGQRLARAEALIARSNCRVGRVSRVSSTIVPRGTVIAQFPEAGTRLRLGGRVNLEVSSGRPR